MGDQPGQCGYVLAMTNMEAPRKQACHEEKLGG